MVKQNKPRMTREDLNARIAVKQEENRARRMTKLTGDDIQRQLAERRALKAEKAPSGRVARVVSLSLGVALLAGSGVLAVTTTSSSQTFRVATTALGQQIAAAQGELDAIPATDQKSAQKYAATLKSQLAEATQKGEEVATLQQGFATILFRGNSEHTTNGAPSAAFLESVKHRKLLAPYFVDRALIADAAQAYAPGSTLPFDSGRIDPRFPWYLGHPAGDQTAVVDPARSSWTLASTVVTKTRGVLEATWINRSPATGQLFAWATASYYTDQGKFGSLKVGTTTLGESDDAQIQTAGK